MASHAYLNINIETFKEKFSMLSVKNGIRPSEGISASARDLYFADKSY